MIGELNLRPLYSQTPVSMAANLPKMHGVDLRRRFAESIADLPG